MRASISNTYRGLTGTHFSACSGTVHLSASHLSAVHLSAVHLSAHSLLSHASIQWDTRRCFGFLHFHLLLHHHHLGHPLPILLLLHFLFFHHGKHVEASITTASIGGIVWFGHVAFASTIGIQVSGNIKPTVSYRRGRVRHSAPRSRFRQGLVDGQGNENPRYRKVEEGVHGDQGRRPKNEFQRERKVITINQKMLRSTKMVRITYCGNKSNGKTLQEAPHSTYFFSFFDFGIVLWLLTESPTATNGHLWVETENKNAQVTFDEAGESS